MVHSSQFRRVVAVAVAVAAFVAAGGEASSGIGFELHHKSSAVVRQWAEARGLSLDAPWPDHGSPEYYHELSRHDRALFARRGLAGADGLVAFAAGNATFQFTSLGFLYYAFVTVGTPKSAFLVALDTGSDLFWVPCDCKQCAPLDMFNNSTKLDLRPYSPSQSSTSKAVTCAHALCGRPNACGGNSSCPYGVRYASANTSSSGVLVEDLLYFTPPLQASIVFGCGQVQTGTFLQRGAPDGLLGLGMDKISVPSAIATSGLVTSDSFSMCFGVDNVGRLNFGDTGSSDQAETPFIVSKINPSYNVSFTSINVVGTKSSPVPFTAIMDSGTSFTYLNEPEYSTLATSFDSQVSEKRTNFTFTSGSLPFDYCYAFSTGQTEPRVVPEMTFTAKGGAEFPIFDPIIILIGRSSTGQERPAGYCLAIISNDLPFNIIGQNFMSGLKVVFNREKSVLGWQEFDCYKNTAATATPAAGSPPPRAARSPPPTTTPRDNDGNTTFPDPVPVPSLPRSASSGHAACKIGGLSLLLPLLIAALV